MAHKLRLDYLMAPDPDVFAAVVKKLDTIIDAIATERGCDSDSSCDQAQALSENCHCSLIEFPQGSSIVFVALHILLFPVKALLQYTVPDVRVLDGQGMEKATLRKAFAAVIMCLVWLAIASYATVASLGILAGKCMQSLCGYSSADLPTFARQMLCKCPRSLSA